MQAFAAGIIGPEVDRRIAIDQRARGKRSIYQVPKPLKNPKIQGHRLSIVDKSLIVSSGSN